MPERDEYGRFVKTPEISAKTSTTGPNDVKIQPELEKPVLFVTVNNPIKKILYWLDQVRKHQTTTFAIKLSIPLIALPVIIFAAFQLGRGTVVLPFIKFSSPAPATSQTPKPSPTPSPPVPYSRSGTLKIAKTGTQTKYVLALKNGENVLLAVPPSIDLNKYQNKQVLVTGIYDRLANLIKVTDIAQIELFNETAVPNSSPPPADGSTPPSSSSSAN